MPEQVSPKGPKAQNADYVDGVDSAAFELVANKGAASGYAALDSSNAGDVIIGDTKGFKWSDAQVKRISAGVLGCRNAADSDHADLRAGNFIPQSAAGVAVGKIGYSSGLQVGDGTNTRTVLTSVAAAGTPAWVTGLAASTNRTPSTTRPTLVTVVVRLGTSVAGAAGSATITHDSRAAPSVYVQNPLAAGSWNETKCLVFLLPPNTTWSFTTSGTVSGVDALEVVL